MRQRSSDDGLTTSARVASLMPRSPSELASPTRPQRASSRDVKIREPRKLNRFFRAINGLLTFAFLLFLIVAGTVFAMRAKFDALGPLATSTTVVIPRGAGIIEIAERLEKDGIVSDRRIFTAQYYWARFGAGRATDKITIKAGEYEIKKAASISDVLATLVEGRAVLQKVTIPEGLTSQQIVERLKTDPNLTGDLAEVPPEGALLPDTYRFSRGLSRQEILDRMQAEMNKALAQFWEKRQADLPIQTKEEALVLASIIEKETGRNDERARVAAVFVNRLRKRMRLQSDPTIVYGLVGGQGPLGRPITRGDIDSRTPYNTYQIDGLPPGPICSPGRASIEAALNPAKTDDLYFVADGTGGHVFTSTLKDHNAAVQNWRKVEREQRARQEARAAAKAEAQAKVAATQDKAPAAETEDVPLPIRKPKRRQAPDGMQGLSKAPASK
ncbi:MAG: endolytic transglycosylase MltG [Hyphomicrobiaceae bacterium]